MLSNPPLCLQPPPPLHSYTASNQDVHGHDGVFTLCHFTLLCILLIAYLLKGVLCLPTSDSTGYQHFANLGPLLEISHQFLHLSENRVANSNKV